jgi:acetylglutamate kinase
MTSGYVPVVASIGLDAGALLNVNADVMACRVASALGATELVIAGATAGVLDRDGRTIPALDRDGAHALIESGTAHAGMIAKLRAAIGALEDGVAIVRIVDGRSIDATSVDGAPGTALTLSVPARTAGPLAGTR